MSYNNIVVDKSKKFAVRIIRLYQYMGSEKKNIFYQNNFSEVVQV